jgi:hypothetical protein
MLVAPPIFAYSGRRHQLLINYFLVDSVCVMFVACCIQLKPGSVGIAFLKVT